jgi:O-antigen ligase
LEQPRITAIARYWPALLMIAVIILLPFERWSGLPVLVMSVIGLVLVIRQGATLWSRPEVRLLVLLWLCYWLPMVIGSLDAVMPSKSWINTLAAVRFLLVGLFAIHYLAPKEQRLRLWQWSAWLVLVWTFDALVQSVFGTNLFGMETSEDRLNGIFGPTNMKLGPVLAVFSPLLLEYSRRYWPRWAFVACFGLLLTVILVIGTRAAWVIYTVITLCYLVLYAGRHPGRWLRSLAWVSFLILSVGLTAYQLSPDLEQRFDRSMLFFSGDRDEMDLALSRRVPIWQTSARMALDHPLNGVGPRGFRHAYMDYSDADDPWNNPDSGQGAAHAHQLILEVATETGLVGLIGLIAALVLALRQWRSWNPLQRAGSLPFAVALFGMLFPFNTHLAFYSTFWSLVFWWLVVLYCAASQES